MSDFSAGLFALSENKGEVYPFLVEGELLIQYNEQWVGKLSAMDTDHDFQPQTIALSKEVPLLYIMNAEDYGFLMQILHDGVIKFNLNIPYNAEADLAHEIGNELFGEEWFLDEGNVQEYYRQANEEAAKRLEAQGVPGSYFAGINSESLEVFQLFGFNEEILQKIRKILTAENFTQGSHEMVSTLLDNLGLTDFSFVAHNYVSYGDDRFTILNA